MTCDGDSPFLEWQRCYSVSLDCWRRPRRLHAVGSGVKILSFFQNNSVCWFSCEREGTRGETCIGEGREREGGEIEARLERRKRNRARMIKENKQSEWKIALFKYNHLCFLFVKNVLFVNLRQNVTFCAMQHCPYILLYFITMVCLCTLIKNADVVELLYWPKGTALYSFPRFRTKT